MAIRIVTDNKTITVATAFDFTQRLSAGGSFSFTIPASSTEASYLAVLNQVQAYWDHRLIASGYIKDIEVSGEVLSVRGDDMSFELASTTISASSTGLTDASDAIDWIGTLLPVGWTLDNQITGSVSVFMTEISRETILATLGAICTATGLWFVIDGKTLTVSDAYGSVINGVQVLSLTKRIDSNDIVNKVYPYGNGGKDAAVNLQPSSATVAGYTINKAANSVVYAGSGYPTREREIQLEKIAPRTVTMSALVDAANALVYESVAYLKRYATPIESYSVECFYNGTIMPLNRVALNVKTDTLLVNETPVVVEASTRITAQGLVTTALTLEKDARRIPTDAQVVANAIVQAHKNAIYPAPKAENPTFAAKKHATHSDRELSIPWSIAEQSIQIRKATVTLAATNTGAIPGMNVASFQYRLNDSGSWTTITSGTDIASVLAYSTTLFPYFTHGVLNLRAVAATEHIKPVGGAIGTITTIPSGTKVLALANITAYNTPATQVSLSTAFTITAGTVFTLYGSPTKITAFTGIPNVTDAIFYSVDSSGNDWVIVYVDNRTVITSAINGITGAFDADIDAALSIQSVTI